MAKRGGKRPGAGRPPFTLNKKTILRAEAAKAHVERERAKARPLAIDVLAQFLELFAGMAAHYQPIPPGQPVPPGRSPNEDKFLTYARLVKETASELAPFQSAKLAAIKMMTTPTTLPGDGAKVVEGNVSRLNDPLMLTKVYKSLMARPKV